MDSILGHIVRHHSTAVVVFHQAVAHRLGLGPTDHKCLDLLRERGDITGAELATITGLSSGAITGVVARLMHAGYVRRTGDPHDRRQHFLSVVPERLSAIAEVMAPIRRDMAQTLHRFDAAQLTAIADFLTHAAGLAHQHVALLRHQARLSGSTGNAPQARVTTRRSAARR